MTMLSKPAHITSLATSCILLNIDVRVCTLTKQDKDSSKEFTDGKKADREAASITQHLLAGNARHKAVLNYRQTIYNWKELRTYPFRAGMEILPVADYPQFMKEYNEHETNFNKLAADFIDEYPTIVSGIAFKMGALFNAAFYPTPQELFHKFGVDLYTSEVPEGDFRVQLSKDLADDLYNHYERQSNNIVNGILTKQTEQLIKVMQSISSTCNVEQVTAADGSIKTRRHKLYDSTITRALELCDSFKSFNVTANQSLEDARARLDKTLRSISLDALRESDHMRMSVKSEVDDILSKFQGV